METRDRYDTQDEGRSNKASLRSAFPQIAACVAANSFYLPDGAVLGYSAILIPQLELPKSEIKVTRLQTAWLTSLMVLVVPVGEVLAAVLMERWGRVCALKFALVPFLAGCLVIALANSFVLILVGKVLVGVSLAVGTSPAAIYVTEVARPDLRGVLITAGPLLGAAGLLVAYAAGALVAWRGVAFCCCAVAAVPMMMLSLCCPESPAWLVRQGLLQDALHSLQRLAPAATDKEEFATRQLQQLVTTMRRRSTLQGTSIGGRPRRPGAGGVGGGCGLKGRLRVWAGAARRGVAAVTGQREARRPLVLLCVLMLLQQFTGSYVTLFYAVTFFQDVQSSVDDYCAAALVGLVRFIMAVVTLPLLSRFGRRPLLLFSAAVMAISMLLSGALSRWTLPGARWLPAACVLVYVCASCVGVLCVPWILAAELFPPEIRGASQAITLSLAHLFMFAALQTYRELNAVLGSAGVQWLYAAVCALTVLFVWLLVPETQGRTSEQIERFFQTRVVYPVVVRRSEAATIRSKSASQNDRRLDLGGTCIRDDVCQDCCVTRL